MSPESISLRWFILRRALGVVPLVFGVVVLSFILIHMAPGDVVTVIAGDAPLSPDMVAEIRRSLGLDRPLYEQLVIYVLRVLQGDLGYSFISRQPVLELILDRVAFTLLLTFVPMFFASVSGIMLGVAASSKQYSLSDNLISAITVICSSVPVFWLAHLLILFFSLRLGWFPAQGLVSLRVKLERPCPLARYAAPSSSSRNRFGDGSTCPCHSHNPSEYA